MHNPPSQSVANPLAARLVARRASKRNGGAEQAAARTGVESNPPQRHRATVAAGFVWGMLSGLACRGVDCDRLLEESAIDPARLHESTWRVPIAIYSDLYNRVVRQFDDEGFGLFAHPLRFGTFEFLCRSMIGSRSLEEALERATRFLRIVLPDLAVEMRRGPITAELRVAETTPLQPDRDDPRRVFAFEWILRLLHGLSCWLVGRDLALNSVRFPYARPAHATDYALIYTAHSQFGGTALVALLNANLLDLPIRRDEEALRAFLDGAPGKIAALYRRDREMVRRVKDIVAAALPAPTSLEDVARRLNLSSRSVHRRLHEEGSSLRAIKDALRRDLALARLAKSDEAIADIATNLGYADPSTFYRAFMSWTGIAPTTYRERLAQARS